MTVLVAGDCGYTGGIWVPYLCAAEPEAGGLGLWCLHGECGLSPR
jgi:hypothetical protein